MTEVQTNTRYTVSMPEESDLRGKSPEDLKVGKRTVLGSPIDQYRAYTVYWIMKDARISVTGVFDHHGRTPQLLGEHEAAGIAATLAQVIEEGDKLLERRREVVRLTEELTERAGSPRLNIPNSAFRDCNRFPRGSFVEIIKSRNKYTGKEELEIRLRIQYDGAFGERYTNKNLCGWAEPDGSFTSRGGNRGDKIYLDGSERDMMEQVTSLNEVLAYLESIEGDTGGQIDTGNDNHVLGPF